jgi:uncharacterized membrane protein YqhA
MFEKFFALRSVCLVAVVSLFAGAVLMFVVGAERTANAFYVYLQDIGPGNKIPAHLNQGTLASVGLVQAVDAFLFALVLLIFSYGIYTLFVYDIKEKDRIKLPRWLRIDSISDLKTTLLQVIIVILAVNVLEHVIMVGPESLKWETLIIPVSIVFLAAALWLMHGKDESSTHE